MTLEEKINKMIDLSTMGMMHMNINDIDYIKKRIHQIIEIAKIGFPIKKHDVQGKRGAELMEWFTKEFGEPENES